MLPRWYNTYANVMNSNISREIEQVRFGNTNHRLLDRKFRKHVLHNDDNLNFNQSFRGAIKASDFKVYMLNCLSTKYAHETK